MAIRLGRGRRTASAREGDVLPAVPELRAAADECFTGALDFAEPAHGNRARVFVYEGGLYAVELSGYHVDPITRLVSAGLLDEHAAMVARRARHPEAEVVQDGLVDLDAVARVHQEFLLAGAGAVVRANALCVGRVPDAVTSRLCTIPVPLDDVLEAVALRRERREATWTLVSSRLSPSEAVLRSVARDAGLPGDLAELQHFARGLDSTRSVDEVAGSLGLTRAEGVHLAATLVAAGLTAVEPRQAVVPSIALLVPEAFGERAIDGGGARAAELDPSTTGAVAPSEPAVSPSAVGRVAELEHELAEAIADQRAATARIESLHRSLEEARADQARSGGHR